MARYTGPKCKLCRREGVKLFLKGPRCESQKCAVVRRQQAPGQHGNPKRPPSPYGRQLREKQKVKKVYGILEKQLRRYVRNAERYKGETGEHLLQQLERRLDNVVYRLGMAHSRAHARQLVRQNKVLVNGKVVNRPAFSVSGTDSLSFADKRLVMVREVKVPLWLQWDKVKKVGSVSALPKREEIGEPIDEQLIVAFYSR